MTKYDNRQISSFRLIVALSIFLLIGILVFFRAHILSALPRPLLIELLSFRYHFSVDHRVRILASDGIELAASLYIPNNRTQPIGTILIREPYGRMEYGEGINFAQYFVRNGFAVLVQDVRGKYDSGGEFIPYKHATADGIATLDWITRQPWSNGRVGTFGCSALGELQHILSRANHPSHRAMIPLGSGGAVGALHGRHTYFGIFEGGIFQLAAGYGWFLNHGALKPNNNTPQNINVATAIRTLPISDMMRSAHFSQNSFSDFISRPFSDPWWNSLEYISDIDRPAVPALVINTWGDQTVGETLVLAEYQRQNNFDANKNIRNHVIIAPGNHCQNEETAKSEMFGDMPVLNAALPYKDWYREWFNYWLHDSGPGLSELPPYLFYQLGENRWIEADSWPPETSTRERWYLGSSGKANGRSGNGTLDVSPTYFKTVDEFRYDPANPVPSRGGPICCTGNPADRSGPMDQSDIEVRDDVLVYSSAPLNRTLRIAGPLSAHLTVSTTAKDTDFIARLVDVHPDGVAINIQEGALRLRFRESMTAPSLMEPDLPVEIKIDMRSIAYTVKRGHRVRLDITSSSFPRLERNLNTGGNNFDEKVGAVAINRVHHHTKRASYVELSVLPN